MEPRSPAESVVPRDATTPLRRTSGVLARMAPRRARRPPSSSGLGRRPFTAVARVRIPLGVQGFDVSSAVLGLTRPQEDT